MKRATFEQSLAIELTSSAHIFFPPTPSPVSQAGCVSIAKGVGERVTMEQQMKAFDLMYGREMSSEERKETHGKLVVLSDLLYGDDITIDAFSDVTYWESLSRGGLHVCAAVSGTGTSSSDATASPSDDDGGVRDANESSAATERLRADGHTIFAPRADADTDADANFVPIRDTVLALREAGWPPAFALLYDEVWSQIYRGFELFSPILGPDCVMEQDVNVWALRPARTREGPSSSSSASSSDHTDECYIGRSFSRPHRDMSYSACHDDDDVPTSYSAWICINPAGANSINGCMNVIPIENDDYFYSPSHPYHHDSKTALSFFDDEELRDRTSELECLPGSICAWSPCSVHWGGTCDASAEEPRMSVACTFRKFGAKRSTYVQAGGEEEEGEGKDRDEPAESDDANQGGGGEGLKPLSRSECRNPPLRERLRMIAKAVTAYGHWYPGFPGLDLERLLAGSAPIHSKIGPPGVILNAPPKSRGGLELKGDASCYRAK